MYKNFNLKLDNNDSLFTNTISLYSKEGESLINEHHDIILECENPDNDEFDGDLVREKWFPQLHCDIFISHSHQDKDMAIALAGWLKHTFNLKSFIDSTVWDYCDKLQKQLDDKYCKTDNDLYDYQKRNKTTSHVHIMLTSALTKMLDRTECIFFLNTNNSIQNQRIVNNKQVSDTYSPWIYHELLMSSTLRVTPPTRFLKQESAVFENRKDINIFYNVQSYLTKMTPLSSEDIKEWADQYKPEEEWADQYKSEYALKVLYDLKK